MADYLRPCVSLAAWSPRNGGYWGTSGFVSYGNHERYRESQTPWARFWVRWQHMQPRGRTDPALDSQPLVEDPWPGMTPQMMTWQLDNQIAAARAAGLKIVLVVDEFPRWTNGNAGSTRPPSNLGVDSDYAFFIRWLANRYSSVSAQVRGDNVWVDILEVCNEPIRRWTDVGEGFTTAAHKAAEMMHTARTITASTGHQPIIAGPACSDRSVSSPSSLLDFVDRMFDKFDLLGGWRGDQYVAWTQHNYVDCEQQPSTCANAASVRSRLDAKNWRGWPDANPDNPYVLLTEGGAVVSHVGGDTGVQARNVETAWNKCKGLAGIGMFTNYLFWSHPDYDSGMQRVMPFGQVTEPGLSPYPLQDKGTINERKAYDRLIYPTWRRLGTTAPRGVPSYPWNLHVVFIADGRLWHTIRFPTTWQQAGEIGVGKGPFKSVDCAAIGRNLHVVAVSHDGELWHTVRYPTIWQNFTPIDMSTGGERGPWKAASCAAVNGELHVCAITQDGTPWHTIRYVEPGAGSGWQTFGSIEEAAGERGSFVDIDCTNVWRFSPDGGAWIHELHVCGATSDGQAWHTIRHPTHWDGFGTLKFHFSDPGPITKVSCAGKTQDMHLCVATGESRVWHTIRVGDKWDFTRSPAVFLSGAHWEPYGDIETLTGNERGAFSDVDCANVAGDVHVMGVSQQAGRSDSEGWHTIRHAFGIEGTSTANNPRWDGWGTLEGAVGERGSVTAVSAAALFP